MKFTQAKQGRTFVIRLEQDEVVHETLERFAREQGIRAAGVTLVGGADSGSKLVVGPADGRAAKPDPMVDALDGVHEIAGVGTIFPDESGAPVLHMHASCGRRGTVTTGCVRAGVKTWVVGEAIVQELADCRAVRKRDEKTGFALLSV
jgi:predicted DNA-binding protein with PD1-like motif